MSSISIDQIIPIQDVVIGDASNSGSLAGLFLTKNDLVPNQVGSNVVEFTNLTDVGTYFGVASDEYAAAAVYFKSFDGAFKTPDFILFGKYIDDGEDASLFSGEITASIADFNDITAGSVTFIINGTNKVLSALDLSTDNSYSDVAATIQTALQALTGLSAATFVYNGPEQRFILQTNVIGATQTVYFSLDSPLAELLMVREADGAILSQGADATTPAANMDSLVSTNKNWFTFTTLFNLDNETPLYSTYIALANWVTSQPDKYSYVITTLENNLTIAGNTSNIMNSQVGLDNNIQVIYGTSDKAAALMGWYASIDYTRTNSTITSAFNHQAGLIPDVTTNSVALALLAKGVNFYGNYSTSNIKFNWYMNGSITGQYRFGDNLANQVWLGNGLQNSVATLFNNAPKVPNDPFGYTMINSVLDDVMQQAIINGVAAVGNTFDPTVQQLLIQQAGFDITRILNTKGYYIQIVPATSAQRQVRQGPQTTIWYTNGQAIQNLKIVTSLVF